MSRIHRATGSLDALGSIRRGHILQSQVTGTLLLAVLSAVSVTSAIWLNRSSFGGSLDENVERRWLLGTANDAIELALGKINAGLDGTVSGANTVEKGWSTHVVDLGDSILLRARSYTQTGQATSEALIDKVPLPFDAAVYVRDAAPPPAGLTVSGFEHSWDGTAVSTIDGVWDFATGCSVQDPEVAFDTDRVTVAAGVDLRALAKRYYLRADRRLTGGSYDSLWGDAAAKRPEIAHIAGQATIEGPEGTNSGTPLEGAGILVVEGDLHVTGAMRWIGGILVTGDVVLVDGTNTCVLGTLMVGGRIRSESAPDAAERGRCQVLYSADARELVADLVTFEVAERILGGPAAN